jgi:hypothetical protein
VQILAQAAEYKCFERVFMCKKTAFLARFIALLRVHLGYLVPVVLIFPFIWVRLDTGTG